MKTKSNTWTAAVISLLVITADLIRILHNANLTLLPNLPEFRMLTDLIRVSIHVALITMWGFSLYHRIVQMQARWYLCGIAILMLFWLHLKVLKYYIVMDVNAVRYLWYLYYLPLLYIPLFALFAALFLGKAESYRLPRWIHFLHIPAAVLFLLVLSNDLHQLVFRFPADAAVFSDHAYQRGAGYALVFIWFAACSFLAFCIMFTRSRFYRKRKEFLPLILSLALSMTYILTYMVNFPLTVFQAGDSSAACCLLFAAVIESCIYCRMIPTNTRYNEMFAASVGNNAQIVDASYRVRYASGEAVQIPVEKMKEAENGPVMLGEETILHHMPIAGGHAVWVEDISELSKLRRELTDTQEELIERNAMLEYEYNLEKQRKTVEEQNRLYDLLASSTRKQLDQISLLMQDYEAAGTDTEAGRAILSRIAVLGSYVKRKKHLMLSVYSDFNIAEGELKRAFAESLHYLRFMGVRCMLYVDTGRQYLPGTMAALAYDFFETVTETALDSLTSMMVTVSEVSEVFRVRLIVGCGADLRVLQKEYPAAVIEASDEDEWTLVLPLKGGTAG